MINLYFGSKNPYISSLYFTEEANIPKSSTGHLQDPVVERLRDQIMEHYRYVNGMSAKQAFSIKISNTSKLYLHASQYLTVSSSSENFSQNIVVKAMI